MGCGGSVKDGFEASQRTGAADAVGDDGNILDTVVDTRAAGEKELGRLERAKAVELKIDEPPALPVEKSFVAPHPGGGAAGEDGSGEGSGAIGAHGVTAVVGWVARRSPSVRILARRPPRPRIQASASW